MIGSSPWPLEDVCHALRIFHGLTCVTDNLFVHRRAYHVGGIARVASLGYRFHVLSRQGLSKSRPLEYKSSCGDYHGPFHGTTVSSTANPRSSANLCRAIFLPIMVVILPLPAKIAQHFPGQMVMYLQWFAFWTFAFLLVVPWLFCIYRLVTNSLGRKKRIKKVLDHRVAPKTVVVMPVYKEEPSILIKAIDSVVNSDYPSYCIHVFLSYDGGGVDENFLRVIHHLGIPVSLTKYPQAIDVTYRGARITVSRFKHGGKRHCQKQTFKLIDKVYAEYLKRRDDLFVLFIDSDCILDSLCLQNFMYDMELKPGSKHNMLAMTGVITSTTDKNSLITVLQDMEYVHGQLFDRSVESGCGAVTCLPGALTILRFSAFRKMARYYFADKAEQCEDLFDFGKCHLGEDRWLTHLFMIGAKERYQIQMCTAAFCKTEAVQTFGSLLKQRRRWFLGFITNEVCMLTDFRLWKRYPLLCLVRFMQDTIRTTALLFIIMAIAVITTSNSVSNIPVGFVAISLGLNYLLMLYFGAKLRRYKAWLYPIMFLLNPFFNWLYMIYGIFTAGQRTWGGPRSDAAGADEFTTAEEAVEQARAQGDELNVKVDTFRGRDDDSRATIHPSRKIQGRFAAAEQLTSGQYLNDNESGFTLTPITTRLPKVPTVGLYPHYRAGSGMVSNASTSTVHLPRRVESLVANDESVCPSLDTEVGPTSLAEVGHTRRYPAFPPGVRAPPPTPAEQSPPATADRNTGSRLVSSSRRRSDKRRLSMTLDESSEGEITAGETSDNLERPRKMRRKGSSPMKQELPVGMV